MNYYPIRIVNALDALKRSVIRIIKLFFSNIKKNRKSNEIVFLKSVLSSRLSQDHGPFKTNYTVYNHILIMIVDNIIHLRNICL